MFSRRGLVALLALAAITSGAAAATAWAGSGWSPTGDMTTPHRAAGTVRLFDGRVLVVGGLGASGAVPVAELFDPATGTWSLAAPPLVPRYGATATLLSGGRVLLAGGYTGPGTTTAHAELYDPVANTWTATGPMTTEREEHSAVLLANGKVLVAGGSDDTFDTKDTGEVYDPATGTWTAVPGTMSVGRELAQSARLADGRVLVAGGFDVGGNLWHAAADVYHPGTNTWSPAAPLSVARGQGSATLLDDGRVLVAGGSGAGGAVSTFELYDPAAGTWSAPQAAALAGPASAAVKLMGGAVLLTSAGTPTTPVFEPASGTASGTHAMAAARVLPSFVRLDDGRVLAAGGVGLRSAELYTPATTRAATGGAFGDVTVGQTAERDVTFQNTGTERLQIGAPALTGPDASAFAIRQDGCAHRTFLPGQTCTVRLRFTATGAAGTRSAQLTFDDNAETSPAATLTATAVAPPVEPEPGPEPGPQPEPEPQPTPPGPPAPTPQPQPSPGPAPRGTDADGVIACTGTVSIISMSGSGRTVAVGGLALSRLAGEPVTIWSGRTQLGATTIRADGSFAVRVRLPATRQRIRLVAKVAGRSSPAFATDRRLTVVSRRVSGGNVRLTARVTDGVVGGRVTIQRQSGCGKARTFTAVKLDRRRRFTVTLPAATAAQGVVLYRAVAPIAGGTTFTLPIAVTPRG